MGWNAIGRENSRSNGESWANKRGGCLRIRLTAIAFCLSCQPLPLWLGCGVSFTARGNVGWLRVRLLTDRAIAAKTQSELDAILPELKAAIRDHIRYLRAIAVKTIPEAFGRQSKAA